MDRIEKLKEMLAEKPHDSFLQHALALEHVKRGEDAIARRFFEDILSREPGYVGSYYHLARLLERSGERKAAEGWYRHGMERAKECGDRHAYNELQAALDDLLDEI